MRRNSLKNDVIFQDTVLSTAKLFRLGKQEDAHELLNFLLEGLDEDLNQVTRRVPVPEQNNSGNNLVKEGKLAWDNSLRFSNSYIQQLFGVGFADSYSLLILSLILLRFLIGRTETYFIKL